jgi:hypothetical protein
MDPFSLRQVVRFLLSLAHLECLFNKQELKPRQTRLSTPAEATAAGGGFVSDEVQLISSFQEEHRWNCKGSSHNRLTTGAKAPWLAAG